MLRDIPTGIESVYFDTQTGTYYHKAWDMYLGDEDEKAFKLIPHTSVTQPLPHLLPASFFIKHENTIQPDGK
jgi:hypothetical protein